MCEENTQGAALLGSRGDTAYIEEFRPHQAYVCQEMA